MKRQDVTIAVLSSFVLSLWITWYVLENQTNSKGFYYVELIDKVAELKKENQRIHNEILQEESLQVIATKAASMGFQDAQYIYLHDSTK